MRVPPMSNVERQRLFRQRHPGYFGKYKVSKADVARHMATVLATLVGPEAEQSAAQRRHQADEPQPVDPELARAVSST